MTGNFMDVNFSFMDVRKYLIITNYFTEQLMYKVLCQVILGNSGESYQTVPGIKQCVCNLGSCILGEKVNDKAE